MRGISNRLQRNLYGAEFLGPAAYAALGCLPAVTLVLLAAL